ncbi:L-lactate permease [Roseomonas indoligenes]|uniref:L-lactate permease n=1 Tax=Roseomonas indoligenes TaxID=2820811 RepID=A0A940S5J4_9PROT|nr:L-lactate permease [Pararoseomonas indoligenes]MBP0493079.1 L-lactate permease [Pararoseomonas indoligenes]
MDILLQALPLLVLLALLGSGRVAPVPACLAALAASLPAVSAALPPGLPLPRFLGTESLRALFLGLLPVATLSGGLLFSLAAAPRATEAVPPSPRRAYLMILAGSFVESVTGFGVGAVFTVGALRAMGIAAAPAGGMAVLSLWLAPWGGLGPGLALGAALAHRPSHEVSFVTAMPHAAWMLAAPPVLWALLARAGLPVPRAERLVQFGMQAAVAALVVLLGRFMPAETVGFLSSGIVLLPALWRFAPPRDAVSRDHALAAIGPWALLTFVLLLARAWQSAPGWRPYADLPAFGLTHVAVVLWCVSLGFLALRQDGPSRFGEAMRRMRRPAAAMLLYVLLGRWLAGSGAATGLAHGIAAGLGPLAPFAIPPLGFIGGLLTGSGVGAASSMMSVQADLGLAAGLPPWLAPGIHNFASGVGAAYSFAMTAMVCGLLADGTRPPAIWRGVWPLIVIALLVGWAAVAILRALA